MVADDTSEGRTVGKRRSPRSEQQAAIADSEARRVKLAPELPLQTKF
jgi:hypothetical protein